jgi:hypothetical protein
MTPHRKIFLTAVLPVVLWCLAGPGPAPAALFFAPSANDWNAILSYGYYNLSLNPLDSSQSATLRPCQELSLRLVRGLVRTDFGTVVASEAGLSVGMLPNEATLYAPDSTGTEIEKATTIEKLGVYPFPLTAHAGVLFVPLNTRVFHAGIGAGFGIGVEPYPLLYTYLMPSLTMVAVPGVVALHTEVMFIPKSPTYQQDLRSSVVIGRCLAAVNPPHLKVNLVAGFFYKQWRNERAGSKVENVFTGYGLTVGVNFNLGNGL